MYSESKEIIQKHLKKIQRRKSTVSHKVCKRMCCVCIQADVTALPGILFIGKYSKTNCHLNLPSYIQLF